MTSIEEFPRLVKKKIQNVRKRKIKIKLKITKKYFSRVNANIVFLVYLHVGLANHLRCIYHKHLCFHQQVNDIFAKGRECLMGFLSEY